MRITAKIETDCAKSTMMLVRAVVTEIAPDELSLVKETV
jgi:hypothetical protein